MSALSRVILALAVLLPAAGAQAQYYGGAGGHVVRCESHDFRDNYCPIDTRGGVRILRQLSRTPCYEGETWGFDRRGIWVTNGCAAEFEIFAGRPRAYGYDREPPPYSRYGDRGRDYGGERIVCESRDYRYRYCPARVRGDVDLVVQFSKTECRYGRSWGFDPGGVWVDRGCAAEFVVY